MDVAVYRPFLTILIWLLLLQIAVLFHSAINKIFDFGFYLTLLLTLVTIGVIVIITRAISKEIRRELEKSQ